MPTSQNGYSAGDRSVIHSVTVPGTDVVLPVRTGPAGDILVYVAARYHREVEPLRAPDGVLDCWGYADRQAVREALEQIPHDAHCMTKATWSITAGVPLMQGAPMGCTCDRDLRVAQRVAAAIAEATEADQHEAPGAPLGAWTLALKALRGPS